MAYIDTQLIYFPVLQSRWSSRLLCKPERLGDDWTMTYIESILISRQTTGWNSRADKGLQGLQGVSRCFHGNFLSCWRPWLPTCFTQYLRNFF